MEFFAWWKDALAIVIVLGALIFFHELGHFSAAKMLGIGIRTFSLGFGPKLLRMRRQKTEYCLSAIPLGGYVSLAGEEEDADQDTSSEEKAADEGIFAPEEEFFRRPPLHRLLVVFAGPFANFLMAFFIFWGLALAQGHHYFVTEIGKFSENSPSAAAGMHSGDIICSIDGTPVQEWSEIGNLVNAAKGKPVSVEIDRSQTGERLHLTIQPVHAQRKTIFGEEETVWMLGVQASGRQAVRTLGFIDALFDGLHETFEKTWLTWEGVVKLFQRVVPVKDIGGPILIGQLIMQQTAQGIVSVLLLTAIISINLGILNLLPIPVLDGGHIAFFLIEMLIGRPLSLRVRTVSSQIGMALLLAIMLLATWNDISRIFS